MESDEASPGAVGQRWEEDYRLLPDEGLFYEYLEMSTNALFLVYYSHKPLSFCNAISKSL